MIVKLRNCQNALNKLRSLNKADIDEWWTGYAFAIVPIAGSWFTALAAGAAIWAAISLLFSRFRLDLPKASQPLVWTCVALGCWALFIGIYHDGLAGLWRGFLLAAPLFSLPLFIARFRASDPERSFRAMALYAQIGLALAALLAVLQYILRQPMEGGTGNSYVFGFVILSLLLVTTNIGSKHFSVINTLVIFSTLVFLYIADIRVHFIFMAFYACVYLFLGLHIRILYRIIAVTVFSTLIIIIFQKSLSGMLSEIVNVGGNTPPESFGVRFELWKAGLDKLQDAPLFGTGFVSKMSEINRLLPDHLSHLRFTHLHNMFIDAAVAMGMPALFLLSGVIVAAFHMIAALDDDKRLRGFAFLALCITHGSMGPLLTHDIVASVFVVVLAIFAACLEPRVQGSA